VWLYLRFTLSFRDVEDLLLKKTRPRPLKRRQGMAAEVGRATAPQGLAVPSGVAGRPVLRTTASGTEWPLASFIHAMKEVMMDWNRVEGNWKQVKGSVKQQWGELTDDDLTRINGSQEKLEGIIQERYGIARDETRKQIDAWYQNQNWR
jgi:uncharacterized protein YjbJ (UPF0337 family)